ncbi:MAG: hypothetical protein IPH06_07635 [Alphaproteobacteria bacterium]|jgi:hypothetical protein|nr:hypothetical protein [Alphaproteobacteria bacterium]QQS57879.1 MAG: hypothetical protein IPN28_03395 [Alphaproteobacteria bacterium]
MAEIEAPAVLQEADAPQQTAPATEPEKPSLADAAMGRLDNDLANGSVSDADLRQAAKRAYEDLLQKTGGPNQAAASLSLIQQSGALNEGIANQFRGAMTIANGNSDKFAEEIVKRRQDLSQLMLATTPAAQPATAAAGSTPTTGANFSFSDMLNSDFMKPFKQFLESMLSAFSGGKKVNLDTLFAGNKPATANPNAPTTTAGATPQTASTTGQTPAPAAITPPPPASAAATTPPTLAEQPGGVAYDVANPSGGGAISVNQDARLVTIGNTSAPGYFNGLSNPDPGLITTRLSTELPAAEVQTTLASNTATPSRYQPVWT